MQFIKPDINIDFIGKRKIAYTVSAACILITFLLLLFQGGLKYGIDFAGGTVIQIKFQNAVAIDNIKAGLGTLKLGHSSVQRFGEREDNEFLIRTDRFDMPIEEYTKQIEAALASAGGGSVEIRRVEMVGPQVGKDLREKAAFALFYTLLFIAIYISGRFEMKWMLSGVMAAALIGTVYFLSLLGVSIPYLIAAALALTLVLFWILSLKYAMGAIVALIHDVIITVGVFAVFDKEFTLPIVAALLTIVGYSLNDTIIVFDRIRENLKKQHKSPFDIIINRSVNETLSRTLLTAGTTLIVLIALLILGGGIIHDFAFALTIGVVVGTYSSVYVASPILMAWSRKQK
ncbi:MAG: protein translocase subunit SecF [Desulfobacterales bacterium]|jgi:preprotein translocase subunit SecF|nr:protein translocase subunit SecF [Desulfobacterales bacterium]